MNNPFEEQNYSDVRKAGQQLVAKRNDFIQNTRYNMNLLENKIFLYMISKVKPHDTQDTIYEYRFSELFALLRYKTDSYKKIKEMIRGMNALSFWKDAEHEDEDDQLISFFESDSVTSNWKKGYFKIKFGKKIFPYIMDLQSQLMENGEYYTSYQLENVILMSRFYSQRLYEILKSYSYNNDTYWFEIGTGTEKDLQKRLAGGNKNGIPPEGWKNWYIFNRDVLKPAKEDINTYTDLQIEYEPSKYDRSGKHHRGYVMITFALMPKTKGQLREREHKIEAAYRKMQDEEESSRYHQGTIFEFMNRQNRLESLEKQTEQEENELKKEEENLEDSAFEDRIETSKYPILVSEYGKLFTDEQIESLYIVACGNGHIETGTIKPQDRELFASDLIGKYWIKIKATPDDTRTKPFNRLLDAVEKDYDNYAYHINNAYRRTKKSQKDVSILDQDKIAQYEDSDVRLSKDIMCDMDIIDAETGEKITIDNEKDIRMEYYTTAFRRRHIFQEKSRE